MPTWSRACPRTPASIPWPAKSFAISASNPLGKVPCLVMEDGEAVFLTSDPTEAVIGADVVVTDAVPAAHLDAYRRAVVQALGRPHRGVDDAVRAVRTAAVDCRAAWYATQE